MPPKPPKFIKVQGPSEFLPPQTHDPKSWSSNNDDLACAIRELHKFLAANLGAVTKKDLEKVNDELLEAIKSCGGGTKPRTSFGYKIGQPLTKGETMPLELKITNEQQIKVTIKPKTDKEKPASVDGKPTWEIISGNATITVAEDGFSADLVSADDPGDTEVLVKADADLGEGVEEISDIIKLSVVGATAKNLGLVAGPPTVKPDGSGDGGQT